MICIFCSREIRQQVPIIVNILEMSPPWNESGEVGKDTLTNKYACQTCYRDILENTAKASNEISEILLKLKPKK